MSAKKKPSAPKLPTMKECKSSAICSYGYADGRLTVKFNNGGIYHYPGVTPEQFSDMEAAKSIGTHFAAGIRKTHKGVKHE